MQTLHSKPLSENLFTFFNYKNKSDLSGLSKKRKIGIVIYFYISYISSHHQDPSYKNLDLSYYNTPYGNIYKLSKKNHEKLFSQLYGSCGDALTSVPGVSIRFAKENLFYPVQSSRDNKTNAESIK